MLARASSVRPLLLVIRLSNKLCVEDLDERTDLGYKIGELEFAPVDCLRKVQ